VWCPSVKEMDYHPFGFCDLNGRQEVTVARNKGGVGYLTLCSKLHEIHSEEDVNTLLLVSQLAIVVPARKLAKSQRLVFPPH
jgi:hypothetical protein